METPDMKRLRIYAPKTYKINYDELKTVEDVVEVLKLLKITFHGEYDHCRLLKEAEPGEE